MTERDSAVGSVESGLSAIQIGMNSVDIAGSLRFFSEVFGYQNAGGRFIWGDTMKIQGLDSSARGMLWCLLGATKLVQLELFHHTMPAQRPLPADWRPSDLGWTRFGIAVPDVARIKAALEGWGISISGESNDTGDTRRLVFRDPFVGCFIEVLEDSEDLPGGRPARHYDVDPATIYATCSVSDLAASRTFYEDTLGLKVSEDIVLHRAEHEALWGLPGAKSDSFVVETEGLLLEIVCYRDPVGRSRFEDYGVTDQGLLNVALASRNHDVVAKAHKRVRASGCKTTQMFMFGEISCAYVLEEQREVEFIGLPDPEQDALYGFAPGAPF